MATKRTSTRKDFTQTALDVVRRAAGEAATPAASKKPDDGRRAVAKSAKSARKATT